MNIPQRLRYFRKQKGLSQEALAEELGISQSAYARMEAGKTNTLLTHLDRLCEVLAISPEMLFYDEAAE